MLHEPILLLQPQLRVQPIRRPHVLFSGTSAAPTSVRVFFIGRSRVRRTPGRHFTAHTLPLSLYFMLARSESEEYEDSDSESEDPFTSHQARRQTSSGSQRGAMAPFYNYPGAGWTPPFSSAPPLP